MTPLISLSVPVYGTEGSLPALLDSVLAQEPLLADTKAGGLPVEVIIVHDGMKGLKNFIL